MTEEEFRSRDDRESNLVSYARTELALLRTPGEPDEMQDAIERGILAIIRLFADQGHTGSSAPYTVCILEKLLMFQPLTPLTGADDEWTEVAEGMWQSKRCPNVFKDADGRPYDINGIIWRDPDGSTWTNGESRVYIEFPYTPTTEVRDRLAENA